jgi:hypothetical protein
MKSNFTILLPAAFFLFIFACQKEIDDGAPPDTVSMASANAAKPPFNIEVILRDSENGFGLVKFRQDNDIDKIISLQTWIRNLKPNTEYQLQRAVDAANDVDGNCSSNSWLTLGMGLNAKTIITDNRGEGRADLWRSVAAINFGVAFDIHFRIVEKNTGFVALTSDCYEYVVR